MSERVVILVTARMASARYPGKALAPLAGRPLLEVLLDRLGAVPGCGLALATSERAENDPLAKLAERMGVDVFRGDEDDVLRRHLDAARELDAAHVVRVTGDNPLTDLETLQALVALHLEERADYSYVPGDALLMGILSEVISRNALERSWERGGDRHRSELVTLYVKEHPDEFRIALGRLPEGLYHPELRLTVDEAEDVELMQRVFERLAKPGHRVSTREAIALLEADPELARVNAHLRHRAANLRSVALDDGVVERASGARAGDRS
jgi:spore coat polysaccharide biosynthesis protein SpsF